MKKICQQISTTILVFLLSELRHSNVVESAGNITNAVTRLRNEIFSGYNKLARPVTNPNSTVNVTTEFFPNYITIDQLHSILHISGFITMEWVDSFLKWNPADYDNVTSITDRYLEIWIPTLFSDEKFRGFEDDKNFVVRFLKLKSDGRIFLIANVLMAGECDINLHNWPFTQINCTVVSRAESYTQISVMYTYKNSSFYNPTTLRNDTEWQLIKMTGHEREVTKMDIYCVVYNVVMVRHSQFYIVSIITPIIILSMLSLVPFWMKYRITYRLMLLLFVIPGQILFLVVTGILLKNNGDTSIRIVNFLRDSLLISMVGILVTILNHGMLEKRTPPPPVFLTFVHLLSHSSSIERLYSTLIVDDEDSDDLDQDIQDGNQNTSKFINNQCIREWKILTIIFDRVIFFLLLVAIAIIWLTLIPSYYNFWNLDD